MGSTAQATNWAGSTGNELLLFPWGQGWEATGEFTNGLHQVFASLPDYDPTLGQYVPLFRRYAPTQGRWLTPDPAGLAAVDPSNPQTWNRYAYVTNNPASRIDPLGLFMDPPIDPSQNWYEDDMPYGTGDFEPDVITEVMTPALVVWFGGGGTAPSTSSSYTTANNGTQTPRQAATQYCQEHGQLSFDIPFIDVPVTISASTTLGPANYSATNDFNTVFPVIPWPEWLAGGASIDITINAPSRPSSNPTVGLGKNLSVGYFTSSNGPQGLSLSLGPSIGPPINVSVPTNNGCGMLAGGN